MSCGTVIQRTQLDGNVICTNNDLIRGNLSNRWAYSRYSIDNTAVSVRLQVKIMVGVWANIKDFKFIIFIDVDDELSSIGTFLPTHPAKLSIIEDQGWI